jgi:hypothetical protein
MKNAVLWSACFTLLLVSFGFAARPFGTDDAGTVAAGAFEIESGYDLWDETGTAGVGFKHGVTEKMDIGIGFGFNVVSEPKNSFLPSELCLKYAIVPDMIAASFAAEIGSSSYVLNGILTRCIGNLELDANLGYATGDSSVTYAGALIYSIDKLSFGAEVLGNKETQTWLAGARYMLSEGLTIDAGFTSDFDFEGKTATIGIHYEF